MKKWLPFFIALLIPVMIFISFVFMIKKRIFIFKKPFINEIVAINHDIEEMLSQYLKEDVLSRFTEIESKLVAKKTDQEMNDFIEKYKNKISINDSILEEIFISDDKINVMYFYNLSFSNEQMKELKWAVENQTGTELIKVHYQNNRYIFYKKFQDYYVFLTVNPKFFMKYVQKNHSFFNQDVQTKGNAIFLNVNEYMANNGRFQEFIQKMHPDLLKNGALAPLKYEGEYIVPKHLILKMNKNKIWEFDLYTHYVPADFPMTIWHKLILVMTFSFVLIMFIMLIIKIKNASELSQIKAYGDNNELWDDNLFNAEIEEISVVNDEDQSYEEDDYSLEEEGEVDLMAEVENDAFTQDDIDDQGEEEYLQVPDEYFSHEKEFKKEKDHELTNLIGAVTGHEEEIQRYNSIWKNIGNFIADPDIIMSFNLFDSERGEYIPHFKKNVAEDQPTIVKSDNWILERYIYKGQALFISDEVSRLTPLADIFNPMEYVDISSVFIAPIKSKGEIKGIIIIASNDYLEEEIVKEINSLIKMG